MTINESDACISIQRALLDKITINLRRISFLMEENMINIFFYYDRLPTIIEKELVEDVSAEVISDFPESFMINTEIIAVESDKKIHSKGRIIYNRFESNTRNSTIDNSKDV